MYKIACLNFRYVLNAGMCLLVVLISIIAVIKNYQYATDVSIKFAKYVRWPGIKG